MLLLRLTDLLGLISIMLLGPNGIQVAVWVQNSLCSYHREPLCEQNSGCVRNFDNPANLLCLNRYGSYYILLQSSTVI